MFASLAAIAVIVVGGFFALRQVATDEAERGTRERVLAEARLVEAAGLGDGILRGDPAAIERLDALVLGSIVTGSVVRVKLWSKDGTILYSDEPALIGQRFALGEEEQELFASGGADAELSDLSEPENRYERSQGKLLEAHTAIRTPDGTQVLFEIYQRFGSVSASAERLLGALAPPLLGGVAVLILLQLPLAWSMARRLQRGHRERERLLADAVEASSQERRRIAADLHDGVVQDLAGVAFGLAPLAADAERRGDPEGARALRRGRHAAPGRARPAHAARGDPSAQPRVRRAGGGAERRAQPARAAGIATELRDRGAPRRAGTATRSSTASRARRSATPRPTASRRRCTSR